MKSAVFVALSLSLGLSVSSFAQTDVLTQHNDSYRSGANTTETVLTPRNVNPLTFGLLYKLPVDGQVLAQPLVVTKVRLANGSITDLAYLVTLHNTVYCYSVTQKGYSLVWSRNLGPSVPNGDTNSGDISPEIGIVSTPVIDKAAGIIYVVAKTKEAGPTYFNRLHALNILTGAERANSPVAISGSVPGSSLDSVSGTITFNPLLQMNRPGLLLDHGTVYIGFGSHGDNGNYHGWVFAYNATSFAQTGIYNTTPQGDTNYYIPSGAGGIWMAGNGLASDASGNVYFITGNGTVSHDNSLAQTGNSFVKLTLGGGGLTATDFFAPFDSDNMNWADADLGSAGVMIIPGTNFAFGGGKSGDFFVLNTRSMGGIGASSDNVIQRFYATASGLFSSPVAYFMAGRGWTVFTGGYNDIIRAYTVSGSGQMHYMGFPAGFGYSWPGAGLSISANGQSNPILWALGPDNAGNALLRALNPTTLISEYYDSDQIASQKAGAYATFSVLTVANGFVYVPTFSGVVSVYGLRQAQITPGLMVGKPTITKLGPPTKLENPKASKPS